MRENLEGNFTLINRSTTTDIEEVGWLFSVELDSIHGGHGESGTVNEASDVSIKSDVGKSVLGGLFFMWINILGSERVLSHLE